MTLWTPWLDTAIDVVLPRFCVGCGVRRTYWCPRCRAQAHNRAPPELVHEPDVHTSSLTIAAAGLYEEDLRRAVLAFKASGSRELARELGAWLASSIARLLGTAAGQSYAGVDCVPVPASHASRVRRWGVDCVQLLLTAATQHLRAQYDPLGQCGTGGRLDVNRAVRVRGWASGQKGRTGVQRRSQAPRFVLIGDPSRVVRRPVIVVDDVVTTGATVRSCAQTLTQAGAIVVGVAAVARAPVAGGSTATW